MLSYHGERRYTMKEVSGTDIHDLIVFTATPVSLAN